MKATDVLLHPVRLRIVQAVVGRQMTPLEMLAALDDVPQASLYRHIKRLREAGLLQVVAERPVRGGLERTYAVVEDAVALGPGDLGGVEPEAHRRYFATFVGTLLAGFDRYLESSSLDFEADGVGYQQTPVWLTDEEFAELVAGVGELLDEAYRAVPAPGRRRRLLSTVVFPDGDAVPPA